MLIFGSRAAKHWFPDFRDPKGDIDYIDSGKNKSTKEIEYHWIEAFVYIQKRNNNYQYVDPDFLYTIKVSHAAWDIHWDKTMHDILFFQKKGCKLDKDLYHMLVAEWEVIHGKKKVNLNKDVKYFFDDAVDRKIDHEELHQLLKFGDQPLHELIRYDHNKAIPSPRLFGELPKEQQLQCALEEMYVVATERYILPHNMPINHAKIKALKQLITSMTKGWFNLFLIENFEHLVYYKDENINAKIQGVVNDYKSRDIKSP